MSNGDDPEGRDRPAAPVDADSHAAPATGGPDGNGALSGRRRSSGQRLRAMGAGSVVIGGDNSGTVTTNVTQYIRQFLLFGSLLRASATDTAATREVLVRRVLLVETEAFQATLAHGPQLAVTLTESGTGKTLDLGVITDGIQRRRWDRVVLLGSSGAGKTVLCIEVILNLLKQVRGKVTDIDGLIPVRVPAATWTEKRQLDDWLAERVEAEYGVSGGIVGSLLTRRQLLPIIDGIDEIDSAIGGGSTDWRRTRSLLQALYRYRLGKDPLPFVLTCRSDRYRRIMGDVPHDESLEAVELTIQPLSPATIRDYVDRRFANSRHRRAWSPILTRLDTPRGRAARDLLSTPWRIVLATTVVPATLPPATLLVASKSADADRAAEDRVTDALLAQFIPAAILVAKEKLNAAVAPAIRGDGASRPRLLDHRYLRTKPMPDPADVEHWMKSIAAQQRRMYDEPGAPAASRSHIVPHNLWAVVPPSEMRAIHCSWAGWFACFAAATAVVQLGNVVGIGLGSGYVIIVGLLTAWWVRRRVARVPWPRLHLTSAARPPAGVVLRAVVRGIWLGGVQSALCVFGMFSIFSVLGRTSGPLWVAMIVGGASGAALVTGAGYIAAKSKHWAIDDNLDHPRSAVRRAVRIEVFSLVGRAGMTVGVFLAFAPLAPSAIFALSVSFILFMTTESGMAVFRHYTGMLTASAHKLLPWRIGRFLDWATMVGLLRRSGTAYQLRHREHFEWLARKDPRD